MNRRKHTRKRVDLELTFQVEGGEAVAAHAKDMSVGGMFIITDSPPEFGALVTLQITFPKVTKPVQAEATVRWVGGPGIGVQFASLGGRATYEITEYLATCPSIPDTRRPPED